MERADLIRLLGRSAAVAKARDVVIEERDPLRFMGSFADAVATGGNVFFADPAWGERERAQFGELVKQPAAVSPAPRLKPRVLDSASGDTGGTGWLCIPTGGSSGNLKLARHDETTIRAAVQGFCAHFGVSRVNVVGTLPLYHVSGFMAWMRTLFTGGSYLPWSWKDLEAGRRPTLPPVNDENDDGWFLSLVPTQLQRLLGNTEAEAWLRGFRAVFVGGGPSWPGLIEAGAQAGLPLAFSYGMTETAAMVAALRPDELAAGARGSGRPMPHVRVVLDGEGRIGLEGASLFHGYWPETRAPGVWWTEDLGRFDEAGSLHVLGRRDALIITGGEKVDPAEVEAVLRSTGLFADVAVLGEPDAGWGERVVAFYPAEMSEVGGEKRIAEQVINSHLLDHLASYKHPKRYVPVAAEAWPRNEQGKVNRALLRGRL